MRNFLEVIAQQVDKVAERPLEAAMFAGAGVAMWQWLGIWGLVFTVAFFSVMAIIPDVVIYIWRRYTFVTYKDVSVHLSGFHPLIARRLAREAHRDIHQYGDAAYIAAWKKLGATVTYKKGDTDDRATV
jgi:hypothetical protein